jgi:hypothetical protein
MNDNHTAAMKANAQEVIARLRAANICKIALVDDAFDQPEGMPEDEWQRVRKDEEQVDPSQYSDWLDIYGPVCSLRDWLKDLGLDVQCFGQREQNDLGRFQPDILFVDLCWDSAKLVLDEADEGRVDAKQAASIARKALESGGEHFPTVVLMSSLSRRLDSINEEFVVAASIPRGCFKTLEKPPASAADDHPSYMRLLDLLRELSAAPQLRQAIFQFSRAVRAAADEAQRAIWKTLDALAVEDYAYIYNEGLHSDGHPLGDYMLWLMEPQLTHQLYRDDKVREAIRRLDELQKAEVDALQSSVVPSAAFRGLHQRRLWRRADDFALPEEDQKDQLVRLYQGDLLEVQDDTKVWLVLSPACDLAFTRGRREPKSDISVFLLPGNIDSDPANVFAIKPKDPQTRFFERQSSSVIRWDIQRVLAMRYDEIAGFLRCNQGRPKSRHWCLRRKYVLGLVQQWSYNIARIGYPVGPPVSRSADVCLFVRDSTGWPLVPEKCGVVRVRTQDEKHIDRFPRDVVDALCQHAPTELGKDLLRLGEQLDLAMNKGGACVPDTDRRLWLMKGMNTSSIKDDRAKLIVAIVERTDDVDSL